MREKVYFISSTGGAVPPLKKSGILEIVGSRGGGKTARIVLKTEAGKTFNVEDRNIEALTQVGLPLRSWSKVDLRKLPHQLLLMLCFLAGGLWVAGTAGGILASLVVLLIPITDFWPPFAKVVISLRANASDSEDEESTLILTLPLEAYRQLFADDLLKAS